MSVLTDTRNAFCGAIVGRRKSGKTTLLFDMLRCVWRKRFAFIVFISPTLHLQENFWKYIDTTGLIIIPRIDQVFLQKLKAYQSERKMAGVAEEILIVIDDIGMQSRTEDESSHQDEITQLAFAGRHPRMSCVFLAQRFTQISPNYRSQMDFLIFFGSTNKREISAVHAEFGSNDIIDFRRFISTELLTEDHSVLMFMNKNGKKISTVKM